MRAGQEHRADVVGKVFELPDQLRGTAVRDRNRDRGNLCEPTDEGGVVGEGAISSGRDAASSLNSRVDPSPTTATRGGPPPARDRCGLTTVARDTRPRPAG